MLELFLDRLDLGPEERLRFSVTDEAGSVVVDGDTENLEDYNVRLALSFAEPSTYTVTLADTCGAELESVKVEVLPAH